MSRQLTVALLKPDIAALPHVVKRVEQAVIKNNLLLLGRKRFEPSKQTRDANESDTDKIRTKRNERLPKMSNVERRLKRRSKRKKCDFG